MATEWCKVEIENSRLKAEIERLKAERVVPPGAAIRGLVSLLQLHVNADGGVTLTPAEYMTLRLKADSVPLLQLELPWHVHYIGRSHEVVGAFADRLAAEAFVELTRKRDELMVSGPEGQPPTKDAFKPKTTSVATMPVPASREDQPKHDRQQREAEAAAVCTALGCKAPGDEDVVAEALATYRNTTREMEPETARELMRLETLFAKLRGMQYVVVDTSVDVGSTDYCRAAFRKEAAARCWIDDVLGSSRSHEIVQIDELLKRLEK